MMTGSAHAQAPAQALWQPNFALSADQIWAIRSVMTGKQKSLATLPANVNPSVLTVNAASSPGPAAVSNTGSAPLIASSGISPAANGIAPPSPPRGIENYGTYGGVNSVYHYNDILIDFGEYVDFPQSVTGMLWISSDGGTTWGWCSASLVGRDIGVAAGHCVRENHTWINVGIFIPACIGCGRFDANIGAVYAPFGYAYLYWVETTSGWYNNEGIDQGYDISVFVTGGRVGTSNLPGDYTGWNGVCYLNCLQPAWALRQTGFPYNYDGGNYMYEGQHLDVSDGRDYVEGSGAGPGSSGGPWVANAGIYPAYLWDLSSDKGQWPWGNYVFATTSWGYNCSGNTSCSQKVQGGSSLSGPTNNNDGRGTGFRGMYNDACAAARYYFGTNFAGSAVCNTI